MILQISIEGYEWVIGIAIVFVLALIFTVIVDAELYGFFAFLTFFDVLVVWGGLLPLWSVIACLVILTVSVYMKVQENRRVG